MRAVVTPNEVKVASDAKPELRELEEWANSLEFLIKEDKRREDRLKQTLTLEAGAGLSNSLLNGCFFIPCITQAPLTMTEVGTVSTTMLTKDFLVEVSKLGTLSKSLF